MITGALYVAFMLLCAGPLLAGHREPMWDARDMAYPAFAYITHSLADGRFPLWDPYTACGYPFFADPVLAATSPLALAIGAVVSKASLGFVIYWVAHWILGGLGMMALVAALGGGPAGAGAAAVLYSLSGFHLAHAEHTPFLVTAAWLPWAFAAAHAAVERRKASLVACSSVAFAMAALGGYPAMMAVAGLWLALWLCLAFLTPLGVGAAEVGGRTTRLKWIAATLAGAAVLLAIVYAPALYAFFREGAGYTDRVGALTHEVAVTDGPFTLRAWLSLAFPAAGPLRPGWFGTDVSMSNGYAGFLAIPLAASWLARERAPRRHLFLAVVGGLALAAAAGPELPVREALYWVVPITRFLRHNATFRLHWIIPLAAAAGCGISALGRDLRGRNAFAIALATWGGVALAAGIGLYLAWSTEVPPPVLLWPVLGPAALLLAIGVAIAWLAPRLAAGGALSAALAAACVLDGALHLSTNSGTVWTKPGIVAEIEDLPRVDTPAAPRLLGSPTGFMNAHLVVGVPVVAGYVTMVSDFNRVLVKSPFASVLATRRFWVAPGVTHGPDTGSIVAWLAALPYGSPIPVYVEPQASAPLGPPMIPGSFGEATITSYQPERVEVDVVVPGRAGFLASTERFAAGWRVFVDGQEQPVVRTNAFFRGVALPSGRHRVEWRYDPGAFWILVVVAAISVSGTLAVGLYAWRKGL